MNSVLVLACERDGGAWPPVAALAHELSRQGHRVHALCDAPVEYAFPSGIRIPRGFQSTRFIDEVAGVELAAQLERGEPFESLINPLVMWADALAPAVMDEVRALRPEVLVGSMFCLPLAITLARQLNLPVVSLNPGPYVGPNPPRSFEDDYPGISLWWFEACVLPPILRSDMVLHATDQEFDLGFDRLPDNHHYVGPLIWTPPGDAPAEMSEPGPPWITASVSMVNQPDELDLIAAILDAVESLDARVLLTAPDHDHTALRSTPSNVLLTRFVSHAAALNHSRLLLSHAGHGAVMRALWMGVPMVLTPWDRDQFAVAYRASNLGVARVVDRGELSAEALHETLATALEDSALLECSASHHQRLTATNPPELATQLISKLVDKRSVRSER